MINADVITKRFELNFLPSNLHLDSHDKCFVNVLLTFILAVILEIYITSSILEHILLDGSSRILQLPLHLSKLTTNR